MEETIKPFYYYFGCSVKSQTHWDYYTYTILHVKLRGLPLSTLTLVTYYYPLNPEPSLLSKWSCNDVCIQSGNTRQKKYETSNKCCGCPVCPLSSAAGSRAISCKKKSIKPVLWNKWTQWSWASGNNIWQIAPDDWVRVVLDQLHLETVLHTAQAPTLCFVNSESFVFSNIYTKPDKYLSTSKHHIIITIYGP